MKRKFKHNLSGYLLIAPSYTIFFVFMFIPVVLTFIYSLTNYDFYKTMDFIGIKNYVRMFKDPVFMIALRNTGVYSLCTILPQVAFGLVLAVFLNSKIIGQKFDRLAFYLPYITSMAAISMVWLWMFDPSLGILNQGMKLLGLKPQKWLFNPDIALFSIVIMSLWKMIGYNIIVYLAALQQIPGYMYEAATIDGATKFEQFIHITLPMVAPTTFFLFVIACVQSISVFEQVNILTAGGPMFATTTVVHQVYERAFSELQMGYASAMALLLLIITMSITLVNFKYGNRFVDTSV